MKKIYLKFSKRTRADPEFVTLTALARRIAQLLGSDPPVKQALQACLDDLLGAVYSLMYAKRYKFVSRPQALGQKDIGNVLIRARRMAAAKLRTEGKWTAGFYFNNALFRTAAVYHRSLKVTTGDETSGIKTLIKEAEGLYKQARGVDWRSKGAMKINCEVNSLKHTANGIIGGRKIEFEDAIAAIDEVLNLIEALS